MHGENGMESLMEAIKADKINFRGRQIVVCPARPVYGSWDTFLSYVLHPFSFRMAHLYMTHAWSWGSAFLYIQA